jgi:hypothetical protein
MNLGMKLGIDPKVLSDCLDKGTAANWVNSTMNPGGGFSVLLACHADIPQFLVFAQMPQPVKIIKAGSKCN